MRRPKLLPWIILGGDVVNAQDPSAALEGLVTDQLHGALPDATVVATNGRVCLVRRQEATNEDALAFLVLP